MGGGKQIVRWALLWIGLAASPTAARPGNWVWTGKASDEREITIDLVRADVLVERAPVSTSIAIDSSIDAARVEAVERNGSIHIGDRYPPRSSIVAMADCSPPADDRGDYWSYPARFAVHVRLGPGQPLRIRLKQGNIRLPAHLHAIDAATSDGQVVRGPSVGVAN